MFCRRSYARKPPRRRKTNAPRTLGGGGAKGGFLGEGEQREHHGGAARWRQPEPRAFVPPSDGPQYRKTVAGALPVETKVPFRSAEVSVMFVAPPETMSGLVPPLYC